MLFIIINNCYTKRTRMYTWVIAFGYAVVSIGKTNFRYLKYIIDVLSQTNLLLLNFTTGSRRFNEWLCLSTDY